MIALAAKYWRAAAVLAALLAAWFAYVQWRDTQREIGREEVRAEWKKAADVAQNKLEEAEESARNQVAAQAVKDAENEKVFADLRDKLRSVGRLRDPHATKCASIPASPTSATTGAENTAETTGLLSAEFSDMLRDWAREADEINAAYISARQYAEVCSNIGR